MNDEVSVSSQQKVFDVAFETKNELYKAYMPFISQGAIFVRSNQEGTLGEKVVLKVKLPEDHEIYTTQGKIVWSTPKGAQGAKFAGLGIEFAESDAEKLRAKIETLLAGMASTTKTDTM